MLQIFNKIRIGTRSSKLALAQASEVKEMLIKNLGISEDQIEIIKLTTSGDKIQDRNLAEIGGKGLFIKELEEALLANKIDLAVHSAKDVPPIINESTIIAAFTKRNDPRDYFISQKYKSLQDLPANATIGTSSARRKAILLGLKKDLDIQNFRGNVDSRISKLEQGVVDATILALCGLKRIGKIIEDHNIIPLETMLPAAGQGCLAIQVLRNNNIIADLAAKINDPQTRLCVETERRFLRQLGASCKTPVAAYCQVIGDQLDFSTIIFDFNGQETYSTKQVGDLAKNGELADLAANKTKENAAKLLAKICI